MNRKQTLDAAAACVLTDRQRTHGPIEDSFGLIASLWSAYLSIPVTPFAVANMMTLLKIARAKGNPANADNQVDGAGYQACAAELAEPMAAPAKPPVLVGDPFSPLNHPVDAAAKTDRIINNIRECFKALEIHAIAPNAAPVTPESPPEGDRSQTDVRTQGDAIPLDCDGMWHNPDGLDPETLGASDGWRLLLKDEDTVPDDGEVYIRSWREWEPSNWRGMARDVTSTYRTKAPLPSAAPVRKETLSGLYVTKEQSKADCQPLDPSWPAAPEPEWHNPENFTLSEEEKASGWRFLTKSEKKLPDDTMFKYVNVGQMYKGNVASDRSPSAKITYYTKAPLPGTPSADNVHATTP